MPKGKLVKVGNGYELQRTDDEQASKDAKDNHAADKVKAGKPTITSKESAELHANQLARLAAIEEFLATLGFTV